MHPRKGYYIRPVQTGRRVNMGIFHSGQACSGGIWHFPQKWTDCRSGSIVPTSCCKGQPSIHVQWVSGVCAPVNSVASSRSKVDTPVLLLICCRWASQSTPNNVSPKFWNHKRNMPRLLTWRAVSGPPFFSCKRALCPPGVTGNEGYMMTRWGKQDRGCAPSNVRPQVVAICAYREAVSMVRHIGRNGCRAAEIVRQSVYDPCGTFQIASIKYPFGTHV